MDADENIPEATIPDNVWQWLQYNARAKDRKFPFRNLHAIGGSKFAANNIFDIPTIVLEQYVCQYPNSIYTKNITDELFIRRIIAQENSNFSPDEIVNISLFVKSQLTNFKSIDIKSLHDIFKYIYTVHPYSVLQEIIQDKSTPIAFLNYILSVNTSEYLAHKCAKDELVAREHTKSIRSATIPTNSAIITTLDAKTAAQIDSIENTIARLEQGLRMLGSSHQKKNTIARLEQELKHGRENELLRSIRNDLTETSRKLSTVTEERDALKAMLDKISEQDTIAQESKGKLRSQVSQAMVRSAMGICYTQMLAIFKNSAPKYEKLFANKMMQGILYNVLFASLEQVKVLCELDNRTYDLLISEIKTQAIANIATGSMDFGQSVFDSMASKVKSLAHLMPGHKVERAIEDVKPGMFARLKAMGGF